MTPINDIHGKPVRLLAVSRDITNLKQAEEAVKLHNQELMRSNTELERFAFVASHDLKSPLNIALNLAELLRKQNKETLDAKTNSYIDDMVGSLKRMQHLIQDLLNYSLLSSKGREKFQKVDTQLAFKEAVANLGLTEQKGAIIAGKLPVILGNHIQMVRLFQNLFENALTFKSEQLPYVEVSAQQEGQEWVFSIKDNGRGIKKDNFTKIFEIFYSSDDHSVSQSTGIGLATCKKIAEFHNGHIWVESEYGKGSTFYFTIPLIPR